MRVVVVAVDVAPVADVALQPMHGKIEAAQAAGFVGFLDAADGELGGRVFLVLGHKACRLDEHAAGTASRVKDAPVERLDDLGQQFDDAGRGVELPTALAFSHGERTQEILVDAAKGIEVEGGRDLGYLFQQFLEQGAREKVVGLGQHPGQLRVVLFDEAHCGIDLGADVSGFGQSQQVVKPSLWGKVEDAFSVVGRRFAYPATPAGTCASCFQLAVLGAEADFGEAQEDQAKNGAGVFLGLQARVCPELVGGIPQALFQRSGGRVFFRRGNPEHGS